ncbi:MAG TPA: diguanylate cyclase [candidate division WOR-3 bacterium]|uniref:Diguanylate cyclase n=1 Tax=candidate division WOR-3 bacterium TaxID=2052148 RepID=A0A9C9EME6_UNCW3|nr:diguanylate cyclase [candidate division WOR-3 bacterium]
MQVLIYDTDRLRLATVAKNLQNLGLNWTAVTKTDDIKKLIRKRKFDLLVLDGSAVRILDRIKKLDSSIPVVIVMDKDQKVDYQEIILSGIVGLIIRPYRLDFFKKVVEKAVKHREKAILNLKTVASLKQKIQELQTLNEIVQAINSSLEPGEILRTIMEKTADLIKAEGWSVLFLEHDKGELVFEAAAGEAGKKLLGMRLKVGQGVAGWVARYGQSLIVPDVTKDPRFYSGVDKKTKFTTKSILCVPMKSRDKIIGVVEVVNKIGGEPFTDDDLEIFENLVAHITIALQNAAMYRKMEEASLIDDLTQLYNSRYCNQYLDKLLEGRRGAPALVSLIFLDIDFFKLVDDNFGHLVGSETLKRVGERLKNVVRGGDVVVRYGGDEYIVILPNTDKKTATVIAERIRKEINSKPFNAVGRKKFNISVTLGVATSPEDAKTRDELIGKADKAMYEGKLSGRDKVVVA